MVCDRRCFCFVDRDAALDHLGICIVRPSARLAALQEPRPQLVVRHHESDHRRHGHAFCIEKSVEGGSLGTGAREPIENEAGGVWMGVDLRFEHADGHVIRNERTRLHVGGRELTELRAAAQVGPKNIAGAQVNQAIVVYEEGALGAFARPRRAKQNEVQHEVSVKGAKVRVAYLRGMTYDVLVLGSGPGGYVTAIRASQLGLKTAVIEREALGGICLNWGCIPTKALLKSANVFEYIQHAADYGISVGTPEADFGGMVKRSRGVAEGMSKGVQFLMKKNKIDVILGEGTLLPGKKVSVRAADGSVSEISAHHVIIATGARSRVLPSLPQDGKRIIGYREAMTLAKQPKRLVVVGSGAIGVEFAYFYNAIGTQVTVVEYLDRIVPVEDADVSAQLEKSFKKSGIEVLTSAEVTRVDTTGKECSVHVRTAKGEVTIAADVVLSAAGVVANIEGIGLETVGIATDKGKIIVNPYYATNIPGYYAIGDCVPGPALAHVASAEGIICVEKIAGHHPEPLDYGNIPGCTYCFPEVASVGMTEAAAKAAGYEVRVGKFPFSASGKASASGHKDGFVKLIFDAKYGELLGGHMIGANVTEMIAELVAVRKLETTGHELIKTVHPHPTLSEAVMEAAAAAYGEVIHL